MRLLLLSALVLQLGYSKVQGAFNECQIKEESCSQCISFKPQCAWCEDVVYKLPNLKSYHKKCDTFQNHKSQNCKNITFPESNSETTKDAELEGDTRVSPQAITVKLRPGQPTTVPVRIKTPINFPIDLYYLMDLSLSMEDDIQQIKVLGDELGKNLKNITSNFRLGFGGFVDKNTGPYTKTGKIDIDGIIKKGETRKVKREMTFAYKNYLPLNESVTAFKDTVNSLKISFNVDSPEGSLEALTQVISCQSDIKWRNKNRARRIIIVTTDDTFHYSGDGLLGGFTIPNDGKCHMKNNTYDAWDKYDYPSLSQIRSLLIANDIVPIFATTGNAALYKKVSEFIGNGAQAEPLEADSSNIVPLIKTAYERIARTVTIDADVPKNIKVEYDAVCGAQGLVEGSAQCNNIDIGEEVTFNVKLTAESCEADQKIDFSIKTSFDNVNVTLELICDCDCGAPVVNAPQCTDRGNLTCGKCYCDPLLYGGRFCHCTAEEAKNQTLCRIPGESKICNGKGTCDCGECQCDKPITKPNGVIEFFYGDQCQCSNASCDTFNGEICGGPTHGVCDCGKCQCTESWTGDNCEEKCDIAEDKCYNPNDPSQLLCSGKGECKCNQCKCRGSAVGLYCDECVKDCPDPCRDYRECVKCRIFETSDLTPDECIAECDRLNITSHVVVEKVEEDPRCLERDEDDCAFIFTYKKDNVTNEIQLFVQRDRICPAEPDILAIILGVIAGIVGIGLALLLIWKLLATIQDRREFAKFEKDLQNPKWDSGENPIYKKATSTFQNPMYGDKGNENTQSGQVDQPLIE